MTRFILFDGIRTIDKPSNSLRIIDKYETSTMTKLKKLNNQQNDHNYLIGISK